MFGEAQESMFQLRHVRGMPTEESYVLVGVRTCYLEDHTKHTRLPAYYLDNKAITVLMSRVRYIILGSKLSLSQWSVGVGVRVDEGDRV